jgi:hypothetical protein
MTMRRRISVITATVMMMTWIIGPDAVFFGRSASAEGEQPYYSQDFESFAAGQRVTAANLPGYEEWFGGESDRSEIAALEGADGNPTLALSVINESVNGFLAVVGWASAGLQTDGRQSVEFLVQAPSAYTSTQFSIGGKDGYRGAHLRFDQDGMLRINDDVIGTYQPNTWYKVTLDQDIDNRTFAVSINDELAAEGVSFLHAAAPADTYYYYLAITASNVGGQPVYIDNIAVTRKSGPAAETHQVFFQVQDADNQPISGAAVTAGNAAALTDEDGAAVLELASGAYSYRVSKTGYASSTGIVVVEDEDAAVPIITLAWFTGTSAVLLDDDLEGWAPDYVIPQSSDAWQVWYPGTDSQARIVRESGGNGSNVLYLSNGDGSGFHVIRTFDGAGSDMLISSMDFLVRTPREIYLIVGESDGYWGPVIVLRQDGTITSVSGGALGHYTVGTWHSVRFEADLDAKKFDVYLDDDLIGADLPFNFPSPPPNRNYNNLGAKLMGADAVIYLDNFHVEHRIPERHSVTITVVSDSDQTAVPGVDIAVNGMTYTTGSDGKTTFRLPDGDYEFILSGDGVKTQRGNFTLNGEDLALTVAVRIMSAGEEQISDGDWLGARRTRNHQGYSPLGADMIEAPTDAAQVLLGDGSLSNLFAADLDGIEGDEYVFYEGNRLAAKKSDFTDLWSVVDPAGLSIVGIDRFGPDNTTAIVAYSGSTLKLFRGADGEELFSFRFDVSSLGLPNAARTKIADLDTTKPGAEVAAFAGENIVALSFEQGIGSGHVAWEFNQYDASPALDMLNYNPQIAVGDMDGDGTLEVFVATYGNVLVLDGESGGLLRQVYWISGGMNGRNYGDLILHDVNGDGWLDSIVIADAVNEHVSVVVHEPNGSRLRWNKHFEFDYVDGYENDIQLKSIMDSAADVDGDGHLEILITLYDGTDAEPPGGQPAYDDGQWRTLIIKTETESYEVQQELVGAYLYGAEDLDGDGAWELFVSYETEAAAGTSSAVAVLQYDAASGRFEPSFQLPSGRFTMTANRAYPLNHGSIARTAGTRVFTMDADGDGAKEVWINNRAYSMDGTAKNTMIGSPVGLFNFYGEEESLATVHQGVLQVFDPDNFEVPLLTYTIASTASINAIPTAADVDGNGRREIILPVGGRINSYRLEDGALQLLWSVPGYPMQPSAAIFSVPLYDMDGDGVKEIIARTVGETGQARISVLSGTDGSEKWGFTFTGFANTGVETGLYQWAAGDFTGDGVQDLFAFLYRGGFNSEVSILIDGATKSEIFRGEDIHTRGFGPYPNYATVADVNKNGVDDLLMIAKDWLLVMEYDADAEEMVYLVETQQTNTFYYDTPVFTDVNGDGIGEIVLSGGWSFAGALTRNGTALWSRDIGPWNTTYRHFGIADMDGDGEIEAAVSALEGELRVYDAMTGAIEWTHQLGADIRSLDMNSADFDGDGRAELLLTTNHGHMMALNGGTEAELSQWGESRVLWDLDLQAGLGRAIIADADDDGEAEILVVQSDGALHVYDANSAAEDDAIEVTGASFGNKHAHIYFDIESANGKGYSVYLSVDGPDGPYSPYAHVNYHAKGVHIKKLTNGTVYYAIIAYSVNGAEIARSRPVELRPGK